MDLILHTKNENTSRSLEQPTERTFELPQIGAEAGKRIKKMKEKSESSNVSQPSQSQSKKKSQPQYSSKAQSSIEAIKTPEEKRSELKVRMAGFALLALIIGILFAHGYASKQQTIFFNETENYSKSFLLSVTVYMSFIFVVIGFGLYLGYHAESIFSAIITTLFIVSLTIILSPLLQKLWLNVFLNGFGNPLTTDSASNQILIYQNSDNLILNNYFNSKLSILCAISQLVVFAAIIGKVQIYKLFFFSILFIVGWNANYALNLNLLKKSPDNRFFDDYSVSMVYLFGGWVALLVSFDVKSFIVIKLAANSYKHYPKIFSLLGIFFIWLSFCFTEGIIGSRIVANTITDKKRSFFYHEGSLQMFFALCSSTISTISFQIFMNKKPSLTHIFSGSISGAILFGSIASFTTNIAVPIAVGIASGFFSALYNKILFKKVNKNQLYDSLGIFGPIFFTSILSTVLLSPIVIKSFTNYSLNTPPLEGTALTSSGQSGWMLIYFGISTGMGLLTGMIISTIMRCISHRQQSFGDFLMFAQNVNNQQKDLDESLEESDQIIQSAEEEK